MHARNAHGLGAAALALMLAACGADDEGPGCRALVASGAGSRIRRTTPGTSARHTRLLNMRERGAEGGSKSEPLLIRSSHAVR